MLVAKDGMLKALEGNHDGCYVVKGPSQHGILQKVVDPEAS